MTVVFTCLDADTLGGVQQVTHTLAQGLARRGHEVHVIGLQRAAAPFRYVDRPLYHHHVISGRPATGGLARRRADRRLRSLLGEIGPGYAVMTSPSVVARAAPLLPGSLRPIGQYHGSYDHARDCWHLASIRRHYPELDQAVFLSEEDARLFSEHALLPNAGVLPNPLADWPEEMSVLESPRVLGVGRLEGVKRFDRLISAFARSGAPEPWELHLVGDGGELDGLREHARREGVADRVVFRGVVPAAAMPAEYLRASVLGLTSEYEGLPVVLLESAAHGVPAVAFGVSGGVRSVGSVLVPPGDVDAFAVELGRLVDDEEERRRLGADARARAEAYRLEHVLDRWESLFAHLER
ncbi:glycosyltransferase [Nonomuraea gerenzanensis]|uniref:Glycosyl transferase, group 1 n=1 Tax=Nonomuraea gerenzanensis TaxID=93944 RepID=A0A1M4E021_9ACTN|nr:glycosyltransferase [Nonomuraea gerenzanensis]UBU14441.1 glycosyltransferase [Nonomuraea gerenzanensis]SBO92156.1 Glycosyl transferase, group 1 [Nonomuraea gerenzanensis]